MSEASVDAPRGNIVKRIFSRTQVFDFIGQSRTYLFVSLGLVAVCLIGLAVRGLNYSIEFTGGTGFTVTDATRDFTSEDLRTAITEIGVEEAIVQIVDGGDGALISTTAVDEIGGQQQRQLTDVITEVTGAPSESIAVDAVGPRWGQQITNQSLRGLAVFLVLVFLYLAIRFEARMAAAAIVTLIHDIIVTVGVYAIVGFEISPASVIAFLTILGYSLYDTVVVFDRVNEDTAHLSSVSTQTYGEAANQALNDVLVRSLSTSITSLLPVGTLLFVGSTLLGADTLQDLALALFVGMAIGTYSSVVVATPFLVWLKEKEPRWAELKERVEARRGGAGRQPAAATPAGSAAATSATDSPSTKPKPKPAKKSSKASRAKRRR
ncbi:MAG TPA: protein translocase subunit SecF [Egibacteraceae bacterium]|nr:protein translocase subunit SecF [Egibacteraceae bacterium]